MRKIAIIFVLLLAMTGCSTAVKVTKEYQRSPDDRFHCVIKVVESTRVPDETITKLKTRLEDSLLRWNRLAKEETDHGKQVEITFNNYNMRNDGARLLVGMLAGADIIDTSVIVKSSDGSQVLAKFNVVSKNKTALGSEGDLIEDHASLIISYLVAGKKETNPFIK